MSATIEFSAQFGGRDAAEAGLPHLKALKAAAGTCSLPSFPFESLAFILRVDGEVNSYGLAGPGHIDFDGHNYVSIDIGVIRADYRDGTEQLTGRIAGAVRTSVDLLKSSEEMRLREVDFVDLRAVLNDLCESYEARVAE